jgi:F-type H+-transporting ATPase subunit epsilon
VAIQLTIVTPEGEAYGGPVDSVVLPGSEGDFGVLEGHERMLVALRVGALEILGGEGSRSGWAAISSGFVDINAEEVVVLVDHCRHAEDIELAQAESDLARAQEEIKDLSGSPEDEVRRAELEEIEALAEAQIEAGGHASG